MGPESWSAVAGGASAIAAALSLVVTGIGLNYQRKTLEQTMRKNVIDALSYQVERANTSSMGKRDSEWTFPQFANIMLAVDTARNIVSRMDELSGMKREEAVEFFLERLDHNIVSSLKNGSPPDGAFKNIGPISEGLEMIYLWNNNAHFLGFTDVDFGIS
ncbi:TPA: hypothetical protein ACH27V_002444 [Klebsiella quasipneumoniae subsp. similipneumoniae]|uniref:hypothetical protein n=1 Tax=Klebsiella pneumoniae TaxID=573 RepID=UPI0027EC3A19|nr:hypothetical protein [Klebsiella pneumoniae]HDT2605256.1 hypothetical protein [Klebsiella quasipneumoniae subsp. similipneumoniae]